MYRPEELIDGSWRVVGIGSCDLRGTIELAKSIQFRTGNNVRVVDPSTSISHWQSFIPVGPRIEEERRQRGLDGAREEGRLVGRSDLASELFYRFFGPDALPRSPEGLSESMRNYLDNVMKGLY
jgi:hypothetical protein